MASKGEQMDVFSQPEVPVSCNFTTETLVENKPAKDAPGVFPKPLVISPQLEHRQTFIILHGRGSTAQIFGPPLLDTTTTSGEKLQTGFPHAKIIFLTASRNRATIYKRSYTHQWFDNWHMEESTKRQDLMREGLKKSCEYVHSILRREIEIIGKENVILWGLSQGCATSLTSLLTWDGEPFAATVGMCGYLPFANHIEEIANGNSSEDNDIFGLVEEGYDDLFVHSGDEADDKNYDNDIFGYRSSVKKDLPMQAVTFLRDEIDIDDKAGMAFREIPVFLGHGTEDEKVGIEHGREAKNCLDLVGADVQMVEYEGLGHWYSEAMLDDIFGFLRVKLGIEDKA
jgi:predicted esterase